MAALTTTLKPNIASVRLMLTTTTCVISFIPVVLQDRAKVYNVVADKDCCKGIVKIFDNIKRIFRLFVAVINAVLDSDFVYKRKRRFGSRKKRR